MSKLSRNIVANLLGQVFVLLMAFVGTRFVFRGLGGDALGIIIFTLTLGNVLRSVLELGVCSTVVREIAAHRTDDPEYVVGVIGMASLLYWAGFAALTAGTWFAAPPIVHHWIRR
jgi:O-antigen/teichoic acid export membrane protein